MTVTAIAVWVLVIWIIVRTDFHKVGAKVDDASGFPPLPGESVERNHLGTDDFLAVSA